MMKDPRKIFFGMIGALAAILVAGGGVFYFVDTLFANNANELADLKADDAILDEKIRKGRELRDQLDELSFLVPIVDEVLPSKKEQSNLIGELTAIEQQTGVDLQNITFPGSDISSSASPDLTQTEDLESLGTVKVLPVTTGFQCVSFNQLLNFLGKTEDNRRKMQVASIDIARHNDPNDATCRVGDLDVNLVIEVYINP